MMMRKYEKRQDCDKHVGVNKSQESTCEIDHIVDIMTHYHREKSREKIERELNYIFVNVKMSFK